MSSDPREAKAAAVEELAARMQSSTLELVLAATGLNVGSDLAGRIGDSQYVLIARDASFPSFGADLLHIDELSSERYRSSAGRAVRMDAGAAEHLVRTIAISELLDAWSYNTSGNARVLALQEIAREEFGLGGPVAELEASMQWKVNRELRYNRDALTDLIRTQYALTQEVLLARGISDVVSYRAYVWPAEAERPQWVGKGNLVEVPQQPLTCWSPDRQVIADWLKERTDQGVILAARHSAEEIASLPVTGMGFHDPRRFVRLAGDRRAVVDSEVSGPRNTERARPKKSARGSDGAAAPTWQPRVLPALVSTPDALDVRIGRILDAAEEPPDWWIRDDSGYAVVRRDLEFLRIEPQQLRWMLTGESPVGLTPQLYQQFAGTLGDALQQDGISAAQVDVRLKGTAAGFFSGLHKTLPTEAQIAEKPEALDRMRRWFGDDGNRPLRRPYDAMYRLGLEAEPSDFDLDINSTTAVRSARSSWHERYGDRFPGDFMSGHGYLDKQAVRAALPHLTDWAKSWEDALGRPVSLGVFESTGPFDEAALGRKLSAHFKDSDWIIHSRRQVAGPTIARRQPRVIAERPEHLRRAAVSARPGVARS